jgi:dTDP-4-amino-4,6-dideoxygalactose transaminase
LSSPLAIHGGPKAVQSDAGDIFDWPIVTQQDETAVLEVLRDGRMSALDVTLQLEQEFAAFSGVRFALGCNNGTASLHSAMFGCGVGVGDEVICQSPVIWASAMPAFSLGATVVFADIDPHTLTLDPEDVERKITEHTKAIVAVHYFGYPCDMDGIMAVASRHDIKVIEDLSHAHGALFQGRKVGTIGDVAAMSAMSEKGLAIGEGGFLVTDDREIYERAVAFGHYERTEWMAGPLRHQIVTPDLQKLARVPLGGYKYRMHQLSAAVGRVQLEHFPQRMTQIQRSMNYFWDLLEDVPGLKAHRPPADSGSTMGGWYMPHGLLADEVGEVEVNRFCQAVKAEGAPTTPGMNELLHLHPVFNEADIYGHGKPTRIAHSRRDVRQPAGSLPVSERMINRVYSVPWFKHYRPPIIEEYASAFKKVAAHAAELTAEFI